MFRKMCFVQFVKDVMSNSKFIPLKTLFRGTENNHLTSTVHIYNAGKRGTTHSGIIIPESNIGRCHHFLLIVLQ